MNPDIRIGAHIRIPTYYDAWMRGAQTGVVTSIKRGATPAADIMRVRMDHPGIRRRVKIKRADWDDCIIL